MLYFVVLRISIAERLVYRVDFALGTLMRFPADRHADLPLARGLSTA